MSPRHKVTESFNFWHDIKSNIVTRSNWEDRNTQNPIVPAVRETSNKRGLDSSATRSLMRDSIDPTQVEKADKEKNRKKKALAE